MPKRLKRLDPRPVPLCPRCKRFVTLCICWSWEFSWFGVHLGKSSVDQACSTPLCAGDSHAGS